MAWRPRPRSVLALVAFASSLSLASPAARADRREDAQAALLHGDRAARKGAVEEALAAYEESFQTYPKPYVLLRIAEIQRKLGRDADALATYKQYAAKVTRASDRRKADRAIAELDAKLAAAAPEPAPAPAPQAPDTEAPPMREDEVAAARAKKIKRSAPEVTTATAPKEEPRPPGYDPNAPASPSGGGRDESEGPPLYKRWWLWTAIGGGVAVVLGLGVGLGLGLPRFSSELPVGGPGVALEVRF